MGLTWACGSTVTSMPGMDHCKPVADTSGERPDRLIPLNSVPPDSKRAIRRSVELEWRRTVRRQRTRARWRSVSCLAVVVCILATLFILARLIFGLAFYALYGQGPFDVVVALLFYPHRHIAV